MARRHRLLSAAVAIAAVAGLGLGTAAPVAADARPGGEVGATAALLGHICDGVFQNNAKFTITSRGGIPAGSTWQVSTTKVGAIHQFYAMPDSTALSWRTLSRYSVELKAETAIPDGTVIKVDPVNYLIDRGGTRLQISGYGGYHEMHFRMNSNYTITGPCSR